MRIIDNKKDFYDYLQNIYRDDTVVFNRRKSFVFKKRDFCYLFDKTFYRSNDIHYLLLQVCNQFWLIKLHCTAYNYYDCCEDYKLRCIHTWKDYSLPRKLIDLSILEYSSIINLLYSFDKHNSLEVLEQMIKTKDYRISRNITHGTELEKIKDGIPILQEIGLGSIMDPLSIYLSLEEYFNMEKTASERIESVGLTNDNKIASHGFDTKISFRGKQNA